MTVYGLPGGNCPYCGAPIYYDRGIMDKAEPSDTMLERVLRGQNSVQNVPLLTDEEIRPMSNYPWLDIDDDEHYDTPELLQAQRQKMVEWLIENNVDEFPNARLTLLSGAWSQLRKAAFED